MVNDPLQHDARTAPIEAALAADGARLRREGADRLTDRIFAETVGFIGSGATTPMVTVNTVARRWSRAAMAACVAGAFLIGAFVVNHRPADDRVATIRQDLDEALFGMPISADPLDETLDTDFILDAASVSYDDLLGELAALEVAFLLGSSDNGG